jgi:hypothetical protein
MRSGRCPQRRVGVVVVRVLLGMRSCGTGALASAATVEGAPSDKEEEESEHNPNDGDGLVVSADNLGWVGGCGRFGAGHGGV